MDVLRKSPAKKTLPPPPVPIKLASEPPMFKLVELIRSSPGLVIVYVLIPSEVN